MISKAQLNADGSLLFDKPLTFPLKMYEPSPNEPLLYVPKFELCYHRVNQCRLSPCKQRIIIQWWCAFFNKQVGLKDCEGCDERRQESPAI